MFLIITNSYDAKRKDSLAPATPGHVLVK